MTPAPLHRTSRTLPAILAMLAALVLLMAVSSFVRAAGRQQGFPGAAALGTLLVGVAVAAGLGVTAWRAPRLEMDETGVREISPRGVRAIAWSEITRVAGERTGGRNVLTLHRGHERWTIDFLTFPNPEQVVGFVTARLPRQAKPAAPAAPPAEPAI
jgi:hypothetical protein